MNLPGNYRACLCPCHFGNPTELPALRLESGLFTVPSTFPMWGEICSSLRYGTKSTPRAWIAPHPSGNILAAVGFSRESNYGTIERHSSSWPTMASLSSAPLASPVPAHPLGRPTPSFPDSLHDLQLAHGSIGRQISAAPCLS